MSGLALKPLSVSFSDKGVFLLDKTSLLQKEEQAISSFPQLEDSDPLYVCRCTDQDMHPPVCSLEIEDTNVEFWKRVSGPTLDSESQLNANKLTEVLNAEQETLLSLHLELEQERHAATTAANEAISMITRLQKEKAALQMEARQYQRIAEEKAFYDQEAIALLKDAILKREAEKLALEKEVKLYRQRLLEGMANKWKPETTKKELKGTDEFFHLEEEEPLLFHIPSKACSSHRADEEGVMLMPVTGSDSTQEIIEIDLPLETISERIVQGARLLSTDGKNIHESFQPVEEGDPFPPKFWQEQAQDDSALESRVSMSNYRDHSHTPVDQVKDKLVKHLVRSKRKDTGDKSLASPTDRKHVEFDPMDKFLASGQVESTSAKPDIVKVGEVAGEEKIRNKSKSVAEVCWQVVLEQPRRLKEQIWKLRATQFSEFEKHYTAVQGQPMCKDLTLKDIWCVCSKEREKTLQHKNMQDDRNPGSKLSVKYRRAGESRPCSGGKKLQEEKLRSRIQVGYSSDIPEIEEECNRFLVEDSDVCGYEHNADHLVRHPSGVGAEVDYGMPDSSLEIELHNSGAETTLEQVDLVMIGTRGKRSFSTLHHQNLPTGEHRAHNDVYRDLLSEEWSPTVSLCDLCTTSMVIRDKSRMTLAKEVQTFATRLQALEAARKTIRQAYEPMKQNMREMELVPEIAQQLQEFFSTERNSMEREDSQLQKKVLAADSFKGILSFTSLGYHVLALLNNLTNIFQKGVNVGVGHGEDVDLPETLFRSRVATCVIEDKQVDTPTSTEKSVYQEQMSETTFLWSTGFTWLMDERGRSGTALSGWDY